MSRPTEPAEDQPLLGDQSARTVDEVFWDGDEDPLNPRCFKRRRKSLIVFILFSIAILSYISLALELIRERRPE
jgi:hypothetical protein